MLVNFWTVRSIGMKLSGVARLVPGNFWVLLIFICSCQGFIQSAHKLKNIGRGFVKPRGKYLQPDLTKPNLYWVTRVMSDDHLQSRNRKCWQMKKTLITNLLNLSAIFVIRGAVLVNCSGCFHHDEGQCDDRDNFAARIWRNVSHWNFYILSEWDN